MRGRMHKTILLPWLCCTAFYGGTQLVGETEAAFSSQVSTDSINMSAAFVFPETIKQLEDRAQEIKHTMENNFETIDETIPNNSLEELHKKLAEVTAVEQELIQELGALHDLHEEMSTYYLEVQKRGRTNVHTFDYVSDGFQQVGGILKVVQATIDLSHIEAIRNSIHLQIQELEEKKEPYMEHIPTNQPPENSESMDEESMNLTNDKQVTVNEEEALEHHK